MHISCDFFIPKNIFVIHFVTTYLRLDVIQYFHQQKAVSDMKTLYIDVYFFINFTIDIISLYFASVFSKVPTNTRRLIISALLGALIAVLVVFLPEIPLVKLLASMVGLVIMGFMAPKKVSLLRKAKFVFSFIIFESLTGGAVSFIFGILDKYTGEFFEGEIGGAVNRKMLFLSLVVLIIIGVFKMIISFFSGNESEGSVDIEISFGNNRAITSAFIDSGNLAIDPMDMRPVMLVKKELAGQLFPQNIIDLTDIDSLDRGVKKRIRLVPVTRGGETHVLVGVKADSVKIAGGGEEIAVTVVVDKEGGTFGGYKALLPSAALTDVTL